MGIPDSVSGTKVKQGSNWRDFEKCMVVEYCLSGVIGKKGLASGYVLGFTVWKLKGDAAK